MQETQLPQAADKLVYSPPVLRDHGQVSDLTQTNGTGPLDGADTFMSMSGYHS